jgi:hypothetical protein
MSAPAPAARRSASRRETPSEELLMPGRRLILFIRLLFFRLLILYVETGAKSRLKKAMANLRAERKLMRSSTTKGLNVLKIPFCEVTPCGRKLPFTRIFF